MKYGFKPVLCCTKTTYYIININCAFFHPYLELLKLRLMKMAQGTVSYSKNKS